MLTKYTVEAPYDEWYHLHDDVLPVPLRPSDSEPDKFEKVRNVIITICNDPYRRGARSASDRVQRIQTSTDDFDIEFIKACIEYLTQKEEICRKFEDKLSNKERDILDVLKRKLKEDGLVSSS